ncbi:MAG: type II secretion system F family protein [Actinomycetota bacterium]
MDMILLASLGIGAGLALVAFTLLTQAQEKAVVRESLRQLDGYEVENVRDQELLNPLKQRAILPVTQRLTGLGKRFTPVGYVDSTRKKITLSGGGTAPDALDKFLAVRVATVAAIPVVFILVFFISPFEGKMAIGIFGLVGMLLALGPDAILNRKIAERQLEIRKRLPDILDLLVISVEAGLGFEQALDRTIAAVPGPLTEEFGRMLGEARAGARRADALRALDERTDVPEVRSFVLALLQADTFGVSISRVLRTQADEMRIKRRQLAQEQAQKAPVKMLIPMVFCVFPALFVVVLGPAMLNIYNNF